MEERRCYLMSGKGWQIFKIVGTALIAALSAILGVNFA